jgi:hypothetical protein
MLSNHDIDELVKKMDIKNFKGCFYKDKLKKIQPNSSYIINLNSELDENGNRNGGSHWTCLVTDDMKRAFYMDSYGEAEPNEIRHLAKSNQYRIGHSTKNIQSLMSNLCGFFCLGLIYFVNVSKFRTGNLINDASIFLDLFEDLDKVDDVYKNEFILSLFFTQKDSKKLLFDNNNIGMSKDNKLTNKFDIEDKLLQTN